MNARVRFRGSALVWALALGVLADLLVRVDGRPGLNVFLWALAGVGVLVAHLGRRPAPSAREAGWLVAGALLAAGSLMWRDAEALAVFSLLAAIVLLLLAAGRAAAPWVSRAWMGDVFFALMRVGILCAAGPLGWGRGDPDAPPGSKGAGRARTVVRGIVLALPALLVLTALLMSADPVFERMVRSALRVDPGLLVDHLVFTAVIGWLTAGYLRAILVEDNGVMDRLRIPQPSLAPAELSVALWVLNLLFLGFLAVQMRTLFGGADLVEATAGLTYADYARRGFFELLAATAFVVPILLLADWAASPGPARARRILRGSAGVLVVLLGGVILSAAHRMWVYLQAYGLTEQRVYASMAIVWLTVVLGWLALTVLRGRRERFASGALIAALACLGVLHALNPHALIARVNLDRAAAGADHDSTYLGSLSADAVPTIISRLDRLPAAERCELADLMRERWSGERRGGWRTWNVSDWRARRLVAAAPTRPACLDSPPSASFLWMLQGQD